MLTETCTLHRCPYCADGKIRIGIAAAIHFLLETPGAGSLRSRYPQHPAKHVVTFGDGPGPCPHLVLASCLLLLRSENNETNDTILDIESTRFSDVSTIDADALNHYAHERCCGDSAVMESEFVRRRAQFVAELEFPSGFLSLYVDGDSLFAREPVQFFEELRRGVANWVLPQTSQCPTIASTCESGRSIVSATNSDPQLSRRV